LALIERIGEALQRSEHDPEPIRKFIGLFVGVGTIVTAFINFAVGHWELSRPTLETLAYPGVALLSMTGLIWLATAFWRSRVALWVQITMNAVWSVFIVLDSPHGDLTGALFLLATFVLLVEYTDYFKAARFGIPILALIFVVALVFGLKRQTTAWILYSLASVIVSAFFVLIIGGITYKHWLLLRREKQLLESHVRERTREIESALDERRVMLQEIHHRVKNNLQIIASLLRLEAGETADLGAAQSLERNIRRIYAMAVVHETLYESRELHRVDLGLYTRELVQAMRGTLENPVGVDLAVVHAVAVDPDFAVPFGLLVSEIATASAQHSFLRGESGVIHISLDCAKSIELTVTDSGHGLGADFDLKAATSLSLTIIRSLVDQLHGTVAAEWKDGTRWAISLPYPAVAVSITQRRASR